MSKQNQINDNYRINNWELCNIKMSVLQIQIRFGSIWHWNNYLSWGASHYSLQLKRLVYTLLAVWRNVNKQQVK